MLKHSIAAHGERETDSEQGGQRWFLRENKPELSLEDRKDNYQMKTEDFPSRKSSLLTSAVST